MKGSDSKDGATGEKGGTGVHFRYSCRHLPHHFKHCPLTAPPRTRLLIYFFYLIGLLFLYLTFFLWVPMGLRAWTAWTAKMAKDGMKNIDGSMERWHEGQ
jgi:hypothetical protein